MTIHQVNIVFPIFIIIGVFFLQIYHKNLKHCTYFVVVDWDTE